MEIWEWQIVIQVRNLNYHSWKYGVGHAPILTNLIVIEAHFGSVNCLTIIGNAPGTAELKGTLPFMVTVRNTWA